MRSCPIQVFLLALLTLLPFVEASASTGGGTKGTVPQSESAPEIESADAGITFVRAGAELAYWFNAHFGLRALLNYSVLVDDTVRTGCETYDGPYKKDFLCGGVGACLAF